MAASPILMQVVQYQSDPSSGVWGFRAVCRLNVKPGVRGVLECHGGSVHPSGRVCEATVKVKIPISGLPAPLTRRPETGDAGTELGLCHSPHGRGGSILVSETRWGVQRLKFSLALSATVAYLVVHRPLDERGAEGLLRGHG